MRDAHRSKHAAYHELLQQLAQPGCAICHLGAAAAKRYLADLGGEALLDPPIRERLRAALGFCAEHAHALDATAHRLTVAILYEDFLQRAENELEGWTRARRRRPEEPCPACLAAGRQEEQGLRTLALFIDDPAMAAAYASSRGLCLRHTVELCRHLPEPARRRVAAQERARLEGLRAELAEVIRKHDYRFRDEPWGEEKSAPGRAVAKVAGEHLDPGD